MNLENLRKIERKTIRDEGNFELKTALMQIFKALSWLFDGRQNVFREDIVYVAERESRKFGLEGRYNWRKVFGSVKQNDQVKPQNISSSNQVVKKHNTVGDGNCLLHSIFGTNNFGAYKTDKAQEMREEWHKFLSQFESLGDPRMPEALKDQLKTFFQSLLNNPDELNNRPELRRSCQEIIKKVGQVLEDSRKKIEDLKNAIAGKFSVDNEFQKQLYEVMKNIIEERNARSPNNKKEFYEIDTFIRNKNKLLEYIGEDVERCASIFDPSITKERYKNEYITNTDSVMETFFNDKGFYDAYRNSISQQGYFIFRDEIPMLASLANIEIEVFSQNNTRSEIIKPNPEMINKGYERNQQLWGNKKQETIYLGANHYSRAEVVVQDKSIPLLDPKLAKQHQEQEDRKFTEKLQQEESDRQLAIKLQKQEISSFMKNAFMMENIKKTFKKDAQCYVNKLSEEIVQRGGANRLASESMKAYLKPSCSIQAVRLTPHQQHIQQTVGSVK